MRSMESVSKAGIVLVLRTPQSWEDLIDWKCLSNRRAFQNVLWFLLVGRVYGVPQNVEHGQKLALSLDLT